MIIILIFSCQGSTITRCGGYTGYNIRGLESNPVGLEMDGIPQPEAAGRTVALMADFASARG